MKTFLGWNSPSVPISKASPHLVPGVGQCVQRLGYFAIVEPGAYVGGLVQ
jgi:hypothetical protein